jgi:hypothetical protein
LIFAFDEVVALGYRENVSSIDHIRTFTNMDSQEEISFERQQKVQAVFASPYITEPRKRS